MSSALMFFGGACCALGLMFIAMATHKSYAPPSAPAYLIAGPTHDIGKESRRKYPHESWCARCGMTWSDIGHGNQHTIMYTEDRGCFPTCQPCWDKSGLEERLAYVRELTQNWLEDNERWAGSEYEDLKETQELIEQAVRKEWTAAHPTGEL